VTYRVSLEVFEGPLDLLLQLIRREELEIAAVSLAAVTDQFLAYLDQLEAIDPGATASFLEVAAQLLLIKSRELLPRPADAATDVDEGDPAERLAQRLREYAQFKEAAQALKRRDTEGLRAFVRIAPPPDLPRRVDLGGVSISDLLAAVREALDEHPAPPVSQVVEPVTVTIDQRIELIRRTLRARGRVVFRSLLRDCRSRVEIVVTFLGLLELMKAGEVFAAQEELFGDIVIRAAVLADTRLARRKQHDA
jgi:segregation and condensation protein A